MTLNNDENAAEDGSSMKGKGEAELQTLDCESLNNSKEVFPSSNSTSNIINCEEGDYSNNGQKKSNTDQSSNGIVDFTDIIGGNGRWQIIYFVMYVLLCFPVNWQAFAITFQAPVVDFWCKPPSHLANVSIEEWKNWTRDVSTDIEESQCQTYAIGRNVTSMSELMEEYSINSFESIPCTSWEYDTSFYESTFVNKWDLVCNKHLLLSTKKSVYMIGYMISVFVCGQLSDRFGRWPIVFFTYVLSFVSATATAFSSSFTTILIFQFFISFGSSAFYLTAYLMLLEAVGTEHRPAYTITAKLGWSFAYIALPGVAWFVRDWFWLQLTITIPFLLLLPALWLLPESPRWLLSQGKVEKAKKILIKAAKRNGKYSGNTEQQIQKLCFASQQMTTEKSHTASVLDLIKTPWLRKITLNHFFCWFSVSFLYYGLSWNTNNLGGNPYVNFCISGAVEIPATFIAWPLTQRFGRKHIFSFATVTAGISVMLASVVPDDMLWLEITFFMLSKFLVSLGFRLLYLYTSELFPTVVRNVGIGSCSTVGRVGALLSPFVADLGHIIHKSASFCLYGSVVITSGLLVLLLPETNNVPLMYSIEQKEALPKTEKNEREISSAAIEKIRINLRRTEMEITKL